MKKILFIAALAILFIGCNSSNTHTTTAPQPQPPVVIQPEPLPEPEGPTSITGSIRPHFDADGGYVTIQASWKSKSNIDPNSLIIRHSENGEVRDEITPSVFTSGSLSKIDEEIYIYPNTGDGPITHIFKLTYYTNDGVGRSQTWSISQPAADVDTNVSIVPMVII